MEYPYPLSLIAVVCYRVVLLFPVEEETERNMPLEIARSLALQNDRRICKNPRY